MHSFAFLTSILTVSLLKPKAVIVLAIFLPQFECWEEDSLITQCTVLPPLRLILTTNCLTPHSTSIVTLRSQQIQGCYNNLNTTSTISLLSNTFFLNYWLMHLFLFFLDYFTILIHSILGTWPYIFNYYSKTFCDTATSKYFKFNTFHPLPIQDSIHCSYSCEFLHITVKTSLLSSLSILILCYKTRQVMSASHVLPITHLSYISLHTPCPALSVWSCNYIFLPMRNVFWNSLLFHNQLFWKVTEN